MALAQNLQSNKSLVRLEIKDNAIGDYGAACIALSLANHPTLRALDITCNGITAIGIDQVAKHLIGDAASEVEAKVSSKQMVEKETNLLGRRETVRTWSH